MIDLKHYDAKRVISRKFNEAKFRQPERRRLREASDANESNLSRYI